MFVLSNQNTFLVKVVLPILTLLSLNVRFVCLSSIYNNRWNFKAALLIPSLFPQESYFSTDKSSSNAHICSV